MGRDGGKGHYRDPTAFSPCWISVAQCRSVYPHQWAEALPGANGALDRVMFVARALIISHAPSRFATACSRVRLHRSEQTEIVIGLCRSGICRHFRNLVADRIGPRQSDRRWPIRPYNQYYTKISNDTRVPAFSWDVSFHNGYPNRRINCLGGEHRADRAHQSARGQKTKPRLRGEQAGHVAKLGNSRGAGVGLRSSTALLHKGSDFCDKISPLWR